MPLSPLGIDSVVLESFTGGALLPVPALCKGYISGIAE